MFFLVIDIGIDVVVGCYECELIVFCFVVDGGNFDFEFDDVGMVVDFFLVFGEFDCYLVMC